MWCDFHLRLLHIVVECNKIKQFFLITIFSLKLPLSIRHAAHSLTTNYLILLVHLYAVAVFHGSIGAREPPGVIR